jgi:outer membrane beta-barrel protein
VHVPIDGRRIEFRETMMKTMKRLVGLAAVGTLALQAMPALAQEAGTHEVHAYAGELFGDDVTDRAISGQTPELDDDITFGLRYGYHITDALGIEMSAGRTPTSVTNVAGGDIDLDLTTLDVDAVWSFRNGTRFYPYVLAGVGYATADLDRRIQGTVGAQPVSLADDEGFTLNAGLGAKYLLTDHLLLRAEARYRYLDKVVDRFDDSLNTVETTLGVGWQF